MGGPWVGDMYLGPKAICKDVIKSNLVHVKNQKKLYFVQQHEDHFTLNYYDYKAEKAFVLDLHLEMAHIDNVHGDRMVYYVAFNNQDGKYRKALQLNEIKHLPLPDEDIPKDSPIRYQIEIPLDTPLSPLSSRKYTTTVVFFIGFCAFMLANITGQNQAMPTVFILTLAVFGLTRVFVQPKRYITKLSVVNDELHVEYAEGRSNKKKTFKLYDIKIEMGVFGNSRDEYRLMIYNWKKTKHYFMQEVYNNWTPYMIERVGEELSEFTPLTGRTS